MAKTVCIYGESGAGKTTLIGELAEHVYGQTGKQTLLYTSDQGGEESIQPYIELGIIQAVHINNIDPWVWSNNTSQGLIPDGKGGWDRADLSKIGLIAYESLQSLAALMMQNLAEKAAKGISIGGDSMVRFKATDGRESVDIGGSNRTHYGIVQNRIARDVRRGFALPVDWVLWTSSVTRDEDPNSNRRVVGPEVVGKALATEVPRWFHYTFRAEGEPAKGNIAGEHLLYLTNYLDKAAGNAVGLCNVRMPKDAPPLKKAIVKPANIVEALTIAQEGQKTATAAIKARQKARPNRER